MRPSGPVRDGISVWSLALIEHASQDRADLYSWERVKGVFDKETRRKDVLAAY